MSAASHLEVVSSFLAAEVRAGRLLGLVRQDILASFSSCQSSWPGAQGAVEAYSGPLVSQRRKGE